MTYHCTRCRSKVLTPWYSRLHEGQLCPTVLDAFSFRSTIAMDSLMPGFILSFHSFDVKRPPPLSSTISYLPASTQPHPTESLKLYFKKSSKPFTNRTKSELQLYQHRLLRTSHVSQRSNGNTSGLSNASINWMGVCQLMNPAADGGGISFSICLIEA